MVCDSSIFPTAPITDVYRHQGRFLDDVRTLDGARRRIMRRALRWIEASPQPDGIAKRASTTYPGIGLILAIYDDLVIAYVIDDLGVLFLRVQERADLHDDL